MTARSATSSSCVPWDPFEGYFDREHPLPDAIDGERARAWLGVVGWGMRNGLYTYQRPLENRSGTHVSVDGRTMLMMSSYDYLGLVGHPDIERAACEAVGRYGTGCGGVRLMTGTNELHRELERDLAKFKGTDSAVTFTSGYLANLAAVAGLTGPGDLAIVDCRAHRSLVDGCRLAGVKTRFFKHNNPDSLGQHLRRRSQGGKTLIIAEGYYSMDGDICPLPDLIDLKRKHGAILLIDEAHSLGVAGATGRGVDEHFGIDPRQVDVWSGSLSKAVPANGGFLAVSQSMAAYLRHEGAPFMYSGALCPSATAAATAALRVIREEPWRPERVKTNAQILRAGLHERGIDTGASEGPIVPMILGSNERAWLLARALHDHGVFATAVVPPAVPHDGARLRLCAMATHSREDLDEFFSALDRATVK